MSRMPAPAAVTRNLSVRGARLAYDVVGRGPTVLCIQGVGVAGSGWAPQVAALAETFTVITFDNRGIGRSTMDDGPLTIETMADDAAAILEAERCERAHVIGHSMGGLIAQQLAVTRPGVVRSLALLCTFANGRDATRPSWRMVVLGLRCRVGTRRMRRHGMLAMILPPRYLRHADRDTLAADLAALFGRDLADQPPIVSRQLAAMSRFSALARLPEIHDIPTLVVSATHDPIAPPALGRAIASRVAGARYEEFTEASHAMPIQCADRVNELLRQHLSAAETAAAPTTPGAGRPR